MKHKLRFQNFYYKPRGLLIIFLLLFSAITIAQETPAGDDKFYIGTEFQTQTIENTIFYEPFYESGMNTIQQRADDDLTWYYINDYNILACNVQYITDWIAHYTTCYYSKWEAEVDAEADRVGFKHRDSLGYLIGDTATWKNKLCWSSSELSQPRDSLMYGPHYRQDKRYKRWLYWDQMDSVYYIPRFIMALDNHGDADPNEDVCRIKVVLRYKVEATGHHNYTFPLERTLKVGDFDTLGAFNEFYLHPNPDLGLYVYPEQFWLPKNIDNFANAPSSIEYIDSESFTGIQYCVDWLGNDNLFTLYIDYVEVYDRDGWKDFIDDPGGTATLIMNYADSFKTTEWSNIKYWLGVDEPYSIDCYEPIRVVDELVRSVSPNTPVIVPFNPTWSWDNYEVNGEDEVLQFFNRANPEKITLSVNPCWEPYPILRFDDFEWLRFNLQRTSALDSNFWFNAQTHGRRRADDTWCTWRKPDSTELRSMVMLALSHGAKGIIFKWFDSYNDPRANDFCNTSNVLMDCIVDINGVPTELYLEIKNNLAPRLTGKLGNTLMNLEYTGDYLELRRYVGQNTAESETKNYLTLSTTTQNPTPITYYFHAGFFKDFTR